MKEGALHELPRGWVWTKLESCIEIIDSERVPINSEERNKRIAGKATSKLYPYYGATGQVGWIDDYLFDEELILLGEDGASFLETNKNKAYFIKGKSWVNNHAHVLKAISSITHNQFLCHYLNIFNYQGYVTGTTRYKLNQSLMRKIPILLPPLPEQRAIVSKIEQLFSDLDNGINNFKKAQAQLKLYHQSVLKAACEGKLVPTEAELARAEGRDYEAGDLLLARILKERREKWNGKGKYKEAAAPDISGLLELPEGWGWANVGMISEKIQYGTSEKAGEDNSGIPVLRMGNIQDGKLIFDNLKYFPKEWHELSDFLLEDGDVLFNRTNKSYSDKKCLYSRFIIFLYQFDFWAKIYRFCCFTTGWSSKCKWYQII